jgi:hypothetical protein
MEEMGHQQPPTPLECDNTTAVGILNDTVRQRQSKAMNMRYYWVKDRIKQGHYHIYWAPAPPTAVTTLQSITPLLIIESCARTTCMSQQQRIDRSIDEEN